MDKKLRFCLDLKEKCIDLFLWRNPCRYVIYNNMCESYENTIIIYLCMLFEIVYYICSSKSSFLFNIIYNLHLAARQFIIKYLMEFDSIRHH